MSRDKVVLSYPFSGSLYAYFNNQINPDHPAESRTSHPYYKTLYGSHFNEVTDLTLTFSILFKEIILAPADAVMPDHQEYSTGGEYRNPDLGIEASWDDFVKVGNQMEGKVDKYKNDDIIRRILRNVPPNARNQILADALYEIHLSEVHNCPILSAGGRTGIIRRINQLESGTPTNEIDKGERKMVKNYLDVAGLMFNPKSLDLLYEYKNDENIRQYANSFVSVMQDFEGEENVQQSLLESIEVAMQNEAVCERTSGLFQTISIILSFIGLYSPVASLTGIAASGALEDTKERAQRQRWYQLGTEIEKVQSLHQIKDVVEKRLEQF